VKQIAIALALSVLGCAAARAQDISGTWQGRISDQRVVKISRTPQGSYRGEMFFLHDDGGSLNGNPVTAITLRGNAVHFETVKRFGIFDGKLSADGNSITGSWHSTYSTKPLKLERATPKTAWPIDPSPHKTRFVTVDKGVTLEVLDWGGTGPPLVLLAGLGGTAHDFDSLAQKFTARHRVIGITRRDFGLSSTPPPTEENYNPDRLADDDLTVMEALKLGRAVIAGHSIAGQELSAIATHHPEKITGLIYLESAYDYAYFHAAPDIDAARWDGLDVFIPILRRDLAALPKANAADAKVLIAEIELLLPRLQNGLKNYTAWPQPPVRMPEQRIRDAMLAAPKTYPGNTLPILAIYAVPQKCNSDCDTPAQAAANLAFIAAFAKGHHNARILRWRNAEHYIHRTREADVVREMNAFMDGSRKP
jgi:pimeloyl-ACP methyl ester carboxylesterase